MSDKTDELIEKLTQKVELTNDKIEELIDQLNRFVAIKQPQPPPRTTNPYQVDIRDIPELEGLEPDVYANINAIRDGSEVRVTAGWLGKDMFKIVARALSSKGFGRHVAGKDSYWSNKIPVKQYNPQKESKSTKPYKFPSEIV